MTTQDLIEMLQKLDSDREVKLTVRTSADVTVKDIPIWFVKHELTPTGKRKVVIYGEQERAS